MSRATTLPTLVSAAARTRADASALALPDLAPGLDCRRWLPPAMSAQYADCATAGAHQRIPPSRQKPVRASLPADAGRRSARLDSSRTRHESARACACANAAVHPGLPGGSTMSTRNDRKDSRLTRGAALALALEPDSAGAQVTIPPLARHPPGFPRDRVRLAGHDLPQRLRDTLISSISVLRARSAPAGGDHVQL